MGEAVGRLAGQGAADDVGQPLRNVAAALADRHRFLVQHEVQLLGQVRRQVVDVAVRQQVVEAGGGRVLVHGRLGVAVLGDLLGRHEGHGAAEVAGDRQAAHLR